MSERFLLVQLLAESEVVVKETLVYEREMRDNRDFRRLVDEEVGAIGEVVGATQPGHG